MQKNGISRVNNYAINSNVLNHEFLHSLRQWPCLDIGMGVYKRALLY